MVEERSQNTATLHKALSVWPALVKRKLSQRVPKMSLGESPK